MSTWPNRGASGGPCGGWNNESPSSQKKSDHTGLTQANRPPRKPVRFSDRGRDARYRTPPAQIRTCPIWAFGSYLGYVTAKRFSGHG